MKKTLFFAAAAIAMLASCSQNDLEAPVVAQSQQGDAIEFGTYLGKAAGSRAGWAGDITDTELKDNTKAKGFGVFATYTKEKDYDASGATKLPNFMYNQRVYWDVTPDPDAWVYSPVKYWPNGLDDKQTPAADGGDDDTFTDGGKVSFFAYAPYVTKDDANGTGTGIIGMSANNADAHPTITYKMAATGQNVDLLWGTASTTAAEQSGDDLSGNKQAGKTLTGGKAYVNVDLTKQQKDGRVRFLFKHALAKVGGAVDGLQIQLDPDEGADFGTTNKTVVTVNKIIIAKASAATKKQTGILDLATGVWSSLDGDDDFSQSIVSGTPSTGELALNSKIKEIAFDDGAGEESWGTTTGKMLADGHTGVTTTAQSVYEDNNVAPLLYFPDEKPSMDITVQYTIRTKDANLADGYSEVVQKVKKTVTFANTVDFNKRYTLIIKLGITSVKFEAKVADWEDNDDAFATDDNFVNLPLNVD